MSITETSNTHFAKAQFMQEGVHDWQGREGETDATVICTALDALVESNLAVAYEQRTANMLTLVGQMIAGKDELNANERAQVMKVQAQIVERLGLV